jgi:hypothetical protein
VLSVIGAGDHDAKVGDYGAKVGDHGAKVGDHGAKVGDHGAKVGDHGAKVGDHGSRRQSQRAETSLASAAAWDDARSIPHPPFHLPAS